MLTTANIVQANQGSTGSSNASTVTVTLPAATAAGNQLVLVVSAARGIMNFLGETILLPAAFSGDATIDNLAPIPHVVVGSKVTTAGESSWTVLIQKPDGTAETDAVCWAVAEISGLHAYPSRDANVGSGATDAGTATKLVITDTIGRDGAADEVCFAVFANHIASGTPKTVASVANTTSQPGTWIRFLPTVATSNSTGPNTRLDVYYKFPGAVGKRDATVTWSTSVTGAAGLVEAYTA